MARCDLAARGKRQTAGQLRMKLPVADGAVQVDQQTGCRRSKQRCFESPGQLPCKHQGTAVPAAMRLQQRFMPCKQGRVLRGHLPSAMLAGDDQRFVRTMCIVCIIGSPVNGIHNVLPSLSTSHVMT